jgi:hypothetical protein
MKNVTALASNTTATKKSFAEAVNNTAKHVGFQTNVVVSDRLLDRVFGADGKHSVEAYLNLILKTCFEQVRIAFTDNKQWERVRFFYPMPTIEGFFNPEEVLIRTGSAGVEIMLASEEAVYFR